MTSQHNNTQIALCLIALFGPSARNLGQDSLKQTASHTKLNVLANEMSSISTAQYHIMQACLGDLF